MLRFLKLSFHRFFSLSLVTLILISLSSTVHSGAVLQVLPTRVVLENQQRSMNITLINKGDEEGNYRLFLRNIRAEENGKFREILDDEAILDGELFADKMIRFSPRRVTVPARSKQKVRVVLRKPKDLSDGEYRSHLVFRKLPKQESILDEAESNDQLSFAFQPVVEITIPVIVRHGQISAELGLKEVTVINDEDDGQQIKVYITRKGTRSLYGDIGVWWDNGEDEEQRIAYAKGVAVYVPNENRWINLSVDLDGKTIKGGQLRTVFTEDPAYGGNQTAEIISPL
jgi:P pilus assembly chaperone PapD